MSHVRSMLIAAVACSAAVATAACSNTVTGAAAPAGPVAVVTPNMAAAAFDAPALPNAVSIQGEVDPGATRAFAPGSRIFGVDEHGVDGASCTLAIRTAGGASMSAGHCAIPGTPRTLADGTRVGTATEAVDVVPSGKPVLDYSVIRFDVPVPDAPIRIAGRPVSGVLTMKAAKSLPVGTTLCFSGAKSGIRCGGLVSADVHGMEVDVSSINGDSGAAVFVVDGDTDSVVLVGLLSGVIYGRLGVTYLDAALDAAGTTALVDASAAKTVAGNPNFSTRVSPR